MRSLRSMYEKVSRFALLRAAIFLGLGILLLFAPNTVAHIIVYIIAGYIAVLGVTMIIGSLRSRESDSILQFDFIVGVLMLVAALIVVLFARQIISILPIFFGIMITLSGASYLVQAISRKGDTTKSNVMLLAFGALFIIAGLVIIFNPFGTLLLLFRVFGVALAVLGISEIITYFYYQSDNK